MFMASDDDKRLGKYLLKSKLGQGGMGIVYLATDTRLKRDVAIKVLPKEMTSNEEAVKRFLREARAAARLNHPNVVAVYDVDQQRGYCYLVMELVNGCTAADLIAQGPLSWVEATRLIAEACRGLAAAHEAGLVHRDIKPSNIMRTHDGLVKLADFGLAKLADGANNPKSPLTRSGTILGTPHYMSPEQCQGEPVDARGDLYSLGATYFALLTGQPPFPDTQPLQVMFSHCSKPTPDPRTLRADLPAACSAVAMKALAKNRAERFASAKEMLAALSDLLTNAPQLELAPTAQPSAIHDNSQAPTVVTRIGSAESEPADGERTVIVDSTGMPNSTVSLPSLKRIVKRRAVVLSIVGLAAMLLLAVGAYFGTWPFQPVPPNVEPNSGQADPPAAATARASSLELLADFPGIETEIRSVAFSHDEQSLFTGSRDGGVRQWSLADWKVTREFLTKAKDVHAVAASRQWLAAGGDDRVVWLWKLGADQPAIQLAELKFSIMSLAISPNGRRLAVGTSNSVELFELDAQGGKRIREVATSEDRSAMVARSVHSVAFSSDSRWLAAVSWEKCAGVWDANNGELRVARKDLVHELMSVAFVPQQERLVFGAHYTEGLFVWDFGKPESAVRSLTSSTGKNVRSLAVTQHGIAFVNGEWDGYVRTYDINSDTFLTQFQQETKSGVTNLAISPAGRLLATCGGEESKQRGYLHVWKLVPNQGKKSK